MKTLRNIIIALCLILTASFSVNACTNVEINVGVIESAEGRLLSEIIATLILERSGVRADIHYFDNSQDLDEAASEKAVDILVENSTNAMVLLNKPLDPDPEQNMMTVKILYKRDKGLVWLKPFGYTDNNGKAGMAVSKELLDKFPGMPRVLGKLSGAIDDDTKQRLLEQLADGQKPSKVAKDFLVKKRFI